MQELNSDGKRTSEIAKLILAQDNWDSVVESEFVEDDDLDFSFKPITEGLGFNKPSPRIANISKGVKPKIKNNFKYVTRPVRDKQQLLTSLSSQVLKPEVKTLKKMSRNVVDKRELKNFYGAGVSDATVKRSYSKKTKKNKKLVVASVEQRFTAWVIDIAVITLIVIGLFTSILSFANISISNILTLENKYLLISVWALVYIIYFTLLDLDRSLGKSLLRIKVVREHFQPISVMDTFMRTVVGTIGIITFGIPILFDLHGHLSDTKVVKWKH